MNIMISLSFIEQVPITKILNSKLFRGYFKNNVIKLNMVKLVKICLYFTTKVRYAIS
jgi:hypothetical protein